jgi:hypothetical protein
MTSGKSGAWAIALAPDLPRQASVCSPRRRGVLSGGGRHGVTGGAAEPWNRMAGSALDAVRHEQVSSARPAGGRVARRNPADDAGRGLVVGGSRLRMGGAGVTRAP